MRKYGLSITAVAFAFCFIAFAVSSKPPGNSKLGKNWYTVDPIMQVTISRIPAYSGYTKAQVLSMQACRDIHLPVCLVGSALFVPMGSPASNFSSANQIKE
jgi:hypothetical protein